jgi:hypothetical protein
MGRAVYPVANGHRGKIHGGVRPKTAEAKQRWLEGFARGGREAQRRRRLMMELAGESGRTVQRPAEDRAAP